MGFGEACINLHLLTQKLLDAPVQYDKPTNSFKVNPKLPQKWKLVRWYFANALIYTVFFYCIIHLVSLFRHYDSRVNKRYKEEIFVYIFAMAITACHVVTSIRNERNPWWLAQVESEVLRSANIKRKSIMGRKLDSRETAAYILAAGFLFFPFVGMSLPIIRRYDPINRLFEKVVPIPVSPKVQLGMVVVMYYVSCLYGALTCLLTIMLAMTHCYVLKELSEQNLKVSKTYLRHISSVRMNKTANKSPTDFTHTELRNLRQVFSARKRMYTIIRIQLTGLNVSLKYWRPGVIGIGILLCTVSNFGMVELYDELPHIMVSCMLFTSLTFPFMISFLMLYCACPLTYSEELIQFWKGIKLGGMVRREVRSMKPVGFYMGDYFNIKRTTALDILDKILDFTVDALMS